MRVEAVMELMFLSSSSWKILRTSETQLSATPSYICHILCYYSEYIQQDPEYRMYVCFVLVCGNIIRPTYTNVH